MRAVAGRLVDVFGEVEELARRLLAPVKAVGRGFDLLRAEVNLIGEILAPRFEQLSVFIEHGDARAFRTRRDIHAILRIDDDGAAEAVRHARGELPPGGIKRVGPLPAADGHRLRGGRGPCAVADSNERRTHGGGARGKAGLL